MNVSISKYILLVVIMCAGIQNYGYAEQRPIWPKSSICFLQPNLSFCSEGNESVQSKLVCLSQCEVDLNTCVSQESQVLNTESQSTHFCEIEFQRCNSSCEELLSNINNGV